MGEPDGVLDVLAQGRLLALQAVEQLMRQHLVDGAHAVGPLGMALAGIVLDEAGMGEQEGCHRGALAGKRQRPMGRASLPRVGGQRRARPGRWTPP